MGFVTLAICIAAAATLNGTLQTIAIVVAILNGLSLVAMTGSRASGAEVPLNFLTSLAGAGLLIAGIAT